MTVTAPLRNKRRCSMSEATLEDVLMTLVVEFLYFLQHAPEGEIAAGGGPHDAGYCVPDRRVPPQRLLPFIEFVRARAQESPWPDERAFLEQLPAHLGWGHE